MNRFNRQVALRIAAVSVLLACVASPLAWLVARESAEEETVLLAMDESRRLLGRFQDHAPGKESALRIAETLVGGLFDIAEIYDAAGAKLAEAMTAAGAAVESKLPGHARPAFARAAYDSFKLDDKRWVLRVFVPLPAADGGQPLGYFEGVRVVPAWQHDEMLQRALVAALMAGLASLLCGAAIYPVVVHLSGDNERKAREVLDSHLAMMEALGRAIAKRDSDTGGHNYRVAWIAARIGEGMKLSRGEMQALIAGSFLHDVGKIGIPDAVLLKPGRHDEGEMAIMRTHVALGEEIVAGIGWLEGAGDVVAGHHEKWDGSGYPRGIAGDAIPLAARIFAVADVFDALCSRRPYKAPLPFAEAMAILENETGRHFDPLVMATFREIAEDVRDCLAGCDEAATRQLLHGRLHRHFAI